MIEVGVDIGGTFTDVVCRVDGGALQVIKVPTTRSDPSRAVLSALEQLGRTHGIAPASISRFVHGTTVATNAVLERKGARIGLLTTEGFRDILEIGRQLRHDMYAAVLTPETPTYLAPRRYRREVGERIGSKGEVLRPLCEEDVVRAAGDLVALGVSSIAICFLFSFANPAHERRAAEIIRARWPELALSLSSDVDPAFREYERTVVTGFDAYIKPVIDRYLENLELGLREAGVPAPLQIMQSRGGVTSAEIARRRPVRLFLSGPAAGVVGAQAIGKAAGIDDVISVDIGGTSSDIALIRAGKPLIRPEGHVAGYNIRVPMVDVNAIGAGGGSLAWLDASDGLRVGPHSAGSEPGPACYGRGGTQPTVTDASVVLGYLDPDYFAGGTLKLYPELARAAIEKEIARPLGLSVEAAALGIHRVVNAQMTEGIRLVSIRQGYDPRDFALLPLGGAGGIHAAALCRELGIKRYVLASHPGVLSATGLLAAEIEHEVARAFAVALDTVSLDAVSRMLAGLDAECAALMAKEGVRPDQVRVSYFADLCFVGQSHYLEVPLDPKDGFAAVLQADFIEAHRRVFGHAGTGSVEIVNLRAVHKAANGSGLKSGETAREQARPPASRRIHLPGYETGIEARVLDRRQLRSRDAVQGPMVLEQGDTTTLVPPGWAARVLDDGTVLVEATGVAAAVEQGLDPVTVEVVRNKLDGIANEMQSILLRSSFSPIVREGRDASACLFTADGETLAQAVAIPVHLGTLIPIVRRIIGEFDRHAMKPGDIYLMNDPYLGGTHLPDIALVMPIFAEDRLIAFAAALTHHQDVGGMSPGSVPTNAIDIFQEGLRLPPLRLRDGPDVWNDTLLKVVALNSRLPATVRGDINAQVAACTTGAARVGEAARELGAETALAIFDDILARSERMTRDALRAVPPGTYRYVDFNDNDGIELDKPIRIEVAVTIADGRLTCDFTGSSPQVRGPFNCVPSGSEAATYWALRVVTGGAVIPTNGGCFRPVEVITERGSVLNPVHPAPVNARTATIKRAAGCILGALRAVLPERIGADAAGEMLVLSFGGKDPNGKTFVVGEIIAGGSGAGPHSDGVDVIETDVANCMNMPVEAMERDAPIRMHSTRLKAGSGGAGKQRGGLGIEREYEVLAGEVIFTYRGERHFRPASGADGGEPGGLAEAVIIRRDGREEVIPSKLVTTVYAGDRIIVSTAGGGGYGPPAERDREALQLDLADGKTLPAIRRDGPRLSDQAGERTQVTA